MPTPRGGGLGIVASFFFVLAVAYFSDVIGEAYLVLAAWSLPIAVVGFWDDHRHVSAFLRIAIHLAAALGVMCILEGLPSIEIGEWRLPVGLFGYGLGAVFVAGMLNLFNFMDGIDGLAASEAVYVFGALSLFLLGDNAGLAFVSMALAMASLGFLFWNWPTASIFMGDVGSGFLGFILATLVLAASFGNPAMLFVGLILSAVFIVDAGFTLLYRLFSGEKWYQAHRSHAYQHAAMKYGHLPVVQIVWGIYLLYLLPITYFVFRHPAFNVTGLFAACLPLAYLAFKFGAGKVKPDV
ncbi:MAG: MraY family glycosyltransferase [Gammaproteobacteria bacterium]